MGAVREARQVVATHVPGGPRVATLGAWARAWPARHDVRVALAAALGLRIATSLFVALVALGLGDIYRHTMTQMNAQAPALGISLVPVALNGPAMYLTGPWLRW